MGNDRAHLLRSPSGRVQRRSCGGIGGVDLISSGESVE